MWVQGLVFLQSLVAGERIHLRNVGVSQSYLCRHPKAVPHVSGCQDAEDVRPELRKMKKKRNFRGKG
jgi:hypothetical protein